MQLEIVKKIRDCRILSTDGQIFYAAKGNRFFEMDIQGKLNGGMTIGSLWERALARSRLICHLLRLGVHHLFHLSNGKYFVVVRKRAYVVDASGKSELVFRFERGNKPASRGVCITPLGDILMAEYTVNASRDLPMMLHRSRNGAKSFETIHEFKPGQIAHYHFVQWDRYENCLWMGTGDKDNECLLFKSTDSGDNWRQIGGGSQLWRAVSLIFCPDAVYWGTDAGGNAGAHSNYVMRLDRSTGVFEKVLEVQGPCHGNAALRDGTLLVSTGVERGENEKDEYAHLWASRDGRAWEELIQFKKDFWFRNLQFGVIRFPVGIENCEALLFTGMGLVGAGEAAFIARIHG